MAESKYDIARTFTEGLIAALRPEFLDSSKSKHWLAGYEVGYKLRATKNEAVNAYLVSIGEQPMATITIQESQCPPPNPPPTNDS